jgi:hypothetical protein
LASNPLDDFTPWDQTLKKTKPEDALELLAERNFETLLTYENNIQ